ncbi:hypothetical protein HY946_03460 [Candidatus Gottesmanbacteria bacterium]|nr:hypothetical protein [Candidatus Gottesmanbacteria bacterium]
MKKSSQKAKNAKEVRKKHRALETYLPSQSEIDQISKILAKQIDREIFKQKYARVGDVLKIVGAGLLLAGAFVAPNLPRALLPFFRENEYEAWKRFNLPYLKRSLERLEKQKLVEIEEENGVQVVKITEGGRKRVLRYALDELAVKKPKIWNGTWWLISYDLPNELKDRRDILRDYLKAWGFYPLHESVFLHAYSCFKQVDFLREYLGISKYVRVFKVAQIENDQPFRDFFGV